MPKLKTNKSASKRFHVTGTGKLMRTKGGSSHLRRNKAKRVKRTYAEMVAVDKGDVKRVKRMLPYGA